MVGSIASPYAQSIFVTDVATGISQPLAGGEGGNDAAWSPDGSTIAFDNFNFSPGGIFTVPAAGGTRTLVRANAFHAAWSPKNDVIAFNAFDGAIYARDIKKGTEVFVTGYGDRASWSPNGQYIAFDGYSGGVWIIKVDVSGNPQGLPVQLTTSGYGPTWSNNSKTIYFINYPAGDPDVWSVPAAGGTAVRVCGSTGNFDRGDYDPAASNNGKYIAFSSYTNPAARPVLPATTNAGLKQNFPNPFTGETKIGFTIAAQSHVQLTVYNTMGQKIQTLVDASYNAGNYSVNWNGKDNKGKQMPAGIYLYDLRPGGKSEVKKMNLWK